MTHGGLKHYHDEDMQSISLKTDKPLDPDKFFPWIQDLVQGRAEHPALQGHPVVQGRSRALRVPGRAHDPRRRSSAAWKDGREARQPRRVHRPQPAGGEDPQGLRELRGVIVRTASTRMTDAPSRNVPSVADRTRSRSRPARRWSPRIFSATRRCSCSARRRCCSCAPDGDEQRVAVHGGGDPGGASDGARIVTGGDDGKVVATDAKGESETLATDAKHRWIDHVALGPDGAVAWSAGKQAFVRTGKGESEVARGCRRRVGGLAFAPKGFRLAVAHYSGVDALVSERRRPRRKCSTGRARTSASTFSPDGALPRHRDAGADAARLAARRRQGTCACRAIRRKVRSIGWTRRRQVARDLGLRAAHPLAVRTARTARWASSRACWRRTSKRVVAVACHPAQDDRRGRLRATAS